MNLVHAGAAGVVARISSYPLTILKACSSIDEVAEFRDLPDGFIVVVMRLVKKMSVATPNQAIFARRDTLARESGKSIETVGRAIKWLEDRCLITREQKARPGLRGSEALIHPTQKLIAALGFGKEASQVKNDGSVSALHKHSLKKQSGEFVGDNGKLSTKKESAFVLVEGRKLPRDLAWLVKDLRAPVSGVLLLMTQAKKYGKFLSDVVAVVRQSLMKLRGKELIAYIRSLLPQKKDFSYIHKIQSEEAAIENKTQQASELMERKKQEWRGRCFKAPDGSLYSVEDNGYLAVVKGGVNGMRGGQWMNAAFVDAVMDGVLRAI